MITYRRKVCVPLERGQLGHLRSFLLTTEEKFSTPQRFMDWYDDQYRSKIDRTVPPRFIKAIKPGVIQFAYKTNENTDVIYNVVSEE